MAGSGPLPQGAAAGLLALALAPAASAQAPDGWVASVEALALVQADSGLSGGGDFSASRQFLRASGMYFGPGGLRAGFSLGKGIIRYDFAGAAARPWDDAEDLRLSALAGFNAGRTGRVIFAPAVRWDYEAGSDRSKGRTYGFFSGILWQLGPSLRIGPAFGAFTEIGSDDLDFFPALLVDWDITEKWNLGTGSAPGATQGPGLTLSYSQSEVTTISLAARAEDLRFSLGAGSAAPGGTGRDRSVPVVLAWTHAPNPGFSLTGFIGSELGGELSLEDSAGSVLSRQSYDPAPVGGVSVQVRF